MFHPGKTHKHKVHRLRLPVPYHSYIIVLCLFMFSVQLCISIMPVRPFRICIHVRYVQATFHDSFPIDSHIHLADTVLV